MITRGLLIYSRVDVGSDLVDTVDECLKLAVAAAAGVAEFTQSVASIW